MPVLSDEERRLSSVFLTTPQAVRLRRGATARASIMYTENFLYKKYDALMMASQGESWPRSITLINPFYRNDHRIF